MNVDDLTIKQARDLAAMFAIKCEPKSEHPYKIGANYFIRTVTFYLTGRLVGCHGHELVLENAAWIPNTGRFEDALRDCNWNEVEMFPASSKVIVGRAAIVDAVEIPTLPTTQK